MDKLKIEKKEITQQLDEEKCKLRMVQHQYEEMKHVIHQPQQSRTQRENTSTTLETIANAKSATQYCRREETKNVLEYIHGEESGAVFGAWDFLAASAPRATMEELIGKYKRGTYVEQIVKKAVKEFSQSSNYLTEAISLKYKNFLSGRKLNLICKTQSSVFDTDRDVWVPRNVKCLGVDVQLSLSCISNESIDKFVKTPDIGSLCQIPDVPGIARTITGLVFMVIDLHLRFPQLC